MLLFFFLLFYSSTVISGPPFLALTTQFPLPPLSAQSDPMVFLCVPLWSCYSACMVLEMIASWNYLLY